MVHGLLNVLLSDDVPKTRGLSAVVLVQPAMDSPAVLHQNVTICFSRLRLILFALESRLRFSASRIFGERRLWHLIFFFAFVFYIGFRLGLKP